MNKLLQLAVSCHVHLISFLRFVSPVLITDLVIPSCIFLKSRHSFPTTLREVQFSIPTTLTSANNYYFSFHSFSTPHHPILHDDLSTFIPCSEPRCLRSSNRSKTLHTMPTLPNSSRRTQRHHHRRHNRRESNRWRFSSRYLLRSQWYYDRFHAPQMPRRSHLLPIPMCPRHVRNHALHRHKG
jgi:hypothetical protein